MANLFVDTKYGGSTAVYYPASIIPCPWKVVPIP